MSLMRKDFLLMSELIRSGTRVLDVGCGIGDLLDILYEQKQVDGRGIELSQEGVNACVKRGLSVVQGDADTDLKYYPSDSFDYTILSQTLQATQHPDKVLKELMRVGHKLIISITNFGHWRVRLNFLVKGKMPKTKTLKAEWYNTPNIHLCTLLDFIELCNMLDIHIEHVTLFINGRAKKISSRLGTWSNFLAEQAVFVLSKDNT